MDVDKVIKWHNQNDCLVFALIDSYMVKVFTLPVSGEIRYFVKVTTISGEVEFQRHFETLSDAKLAGLGQVQRMNEQTQRFLQRAFSTKDF